MTETTDRASRGGVPGAASQFAVSHEVSRRDAAAVSEHGALERGQLGQVEFDVLERRRLASLPRDIGFQPALGVPIPL